MGTGNSRIPQAGSSQPRSGAARLRNTRHKVRRLFAVALMPWLAP